MDLQRTELMPMPGRALAILLPFLLASGDAFALGPQNLLILVRKLDLDGLRVANRYRELRNVPPENVVYLDYSGPSQICTWDQFEREIRQPALAHIERFALGDRIHCWMTTPGLPYRVGDNSISSAVHFGREIKPVKSDTLGPAGFTEANAYFEQWVSAEGFAGLPNKPRRPLHMHLAGATVVDSLRVIERSISADGANPKGTVYLFEGAGPRGSRKITIPYAERLLQALGRPCQQKPGSSFIGVDDVIGLYTGDVTFPVLRNRFLPGALADHLTSYGGALANPYGQMLCRDFLDAGCAATYGAVIEPYNYPQKFPTALVHVFYAAGFTAAESYWMSVLWPQQGLFMGDPLCRPFAAKPQVRLVRPTSMLEVPGALPLELTTDVADSAAGVAVIEIQIDGRRLSMLAQNRLPAPATISLTFGQRTVEASAKAGEATPVMLERVRAALASIGVDSLVGPGSIFVYDVPNPNGPRRVSAKSDSGAVHASFVSNQLIAGSPKPLFAKWGFSGKAVADEKWTLEWREAGGDPRKFEFTPVAGASGPDAVAAAAAEWARSLPVEYRPSSSTQNGVGVLTIAAAPEKIQARPECRLVVKAAGSLGWSNRSPENWQRFVDPTRQAYDLGLLRIGFGPLHEKFSTTAKLDAVSEGLHYLRAYAYRGNETLIAGSAEVPFVKKTKPGRLRLKGMRASLTIRDRETPVAQAELAGLEAAGPVEFRIDERRIDGPSAKGNSLSVDPREFGIGAHRIRAKVGIPGGGFQESDDAVDFRIEP